MQNYQLNFEIKPKQLENNSNLNNEHSKSPRERSYSYSIYNSSKKRISSVKGSMVSDSRESSFVKLNKNTDRKTETHTIFSEHKLSQIKPEDQNTKTIGHYALQNSEDLSSLTQSLTLNQTENQFNSKTIKYKTFIIFRQIHDTHLLETNKLHEKTLKYEAKNTKAHNSVKNHISINKSPPKFVKSPEDFLILKNLKQASQSKIIPFAEFIKERNQSKGCDPVKTQIREGRATKNKQQIVNNPLINQPINVDLSDKQFTNSLSRPTSTMSRCSGKDNEYLDHLKQRFARDSDFKEVKSSLSKKLKMATNIHKTVAHTGSEISSVISEQESKKSIIKVAEQVKRKLQGNTAFRQEANTQDLQECKCVIGSENEECLVPSKDNSVSKEHSKAKSKLKMMANASDQRHDAKDANERTSYTSHHKLYQKYVKS